MAELFETLLICAFCMKERCYRFPEVNTHCCSILNKCSYCGTRDVVWNIDDLLPGWVDEQRTIEVARNEES